jgi:hypothetical protein
MQEHSVSFQKFEPYVHLKAKQLVVSTLQQGCQIKKNPNLGKILRAFEWEIFYDHWEYFTALWNILRAFGIFTAGWYGLLFGIFLSFWYVWTK